MRRPDPGPARRLAALLVAGLSALLAPGATPSAHAAAADPQAEAETRLMCYCGCTDLTVKVCNCGTAASIKADIAGRLAAGSSVDQVIDAYVAEYGEQILSAPTTSGFNLLAWIMPFAALFAGGFLVLSLVRRWRHAPGALPAPDAPLQAVAGAGGASGAAAPRSAAAEANLRERIEREMKESL